VKPFLFALRQEPSQRLDLSRLTPDRLVGRTQKEIEAIDIGTTKVDAKVGDLFKVRVGDPQVVHFEGGSERFDLLGAKLLPGFAIHVEGDVGAQLGRGAQGGTITIAGDAGAFARPHTAAGALKSINDAIALGEAIQAQDSLDQALNVWNAARTETNNKLVTYGNQLGRALVKEIPDWSKMDAAEMQKWFLSIVEVPATMRDQYRTDVQPPR